MIPNWEEIWRRSPPMGVFSRKYFNAIFDTFAAPKKSV
jgi:hypothetical protein